MSKSATLILPRNTKLSFMLLLVLPLFAMVSAKAAEIGRTELDGREIILHDNKTWEYADGQDANLDTDCVKIESKMLPVSICLNDGIWKNGSRNAAAEFTFATKGEDLFLMVIPEKNEIELGAYEKAIVGNAQSAAGLKPVDVVLKDRFGAQGLEWGKMIYDAEINGLNIRYENYFTTIAGHGSVQFVFYTTPASYDGVLPQVERAMNNVVVSQ